MTTTTATSTDLRGAGTSTYTRRTARRSPSRRTTWMLAGAGCRRGRRRSASSSASSCRPTAIRPLAVGASHQLGRPSATPRGRQHGLGPVRASVARHAASVEATQVAHGTARRAQRRRRAAAAPVTSAGLAGRPGVGQPAGLPGVQPGKPALGADLGVRLASTRRPAARHHWAGSGPGASGRVPRAGSVADGPERFEGGDTGTQLGLDGQRVVASGGRDEASQAVPLGGDGGGDSPGLGGGNRFEELLREVGVVGGEGRKDERRPQEP